MIKESSYYHKKSSEIQKVTYLVLDQKFEEMATSVPVLSTIVKKWSLEEIFKFNPS
jgi:hypothetical protein